jgi:hypothetical protein
VRVAFWVALNSMPVLRLRLTLTLAALIRLSEYPNQPLVVAAIAEVIRNIPANGEHCRIAPLVVMNCSYGISMVSENTDDVVKVATPLCGDPAR